MTLKKQNTDMLNHTTGMIKQSDITTLRAATNDKLLKDEKASAVSRGQRLEKAIKQNQTFEELDKIRKNDTAIYRT